MELVFPIVDASVINGLHVLNGLRATWPLCVASLESTYSPKAQRRQTSQATPAAMMLRSLVNPPQPP